MNIGVNLEKACPTYFFNGLLVIAPQYGQAAMGTEAIVRSKGSGEPMPHLSRVTRVPVVVPRLDTA